MEWFRRFKGPQQQALQYARSLIEASLDPLVTISPEGKVTDVNEATIKVTGFPRQVLVGTDFSNYFTEPDKAREGYRQVFEKGFVTDYPLTIRNATGQLTHVLYNASLYKDEYGRVLGVFAAARDVTAQKRTSQYARSLIEAALDPLVTISAQGKITDVNQATIKATGVPREKLIGTDFSDYFTEPEKARAGYREVFEKGFVTNYPLTIQHKNGQLTDVLYNASVYRDEQGGVLGVFAAARDVTESKRAMRDFVETKNFLDNILQSSIKYSIIGKDLDRRILSWNEGAKRNYGYLVEEIIGKSSNILHTPEDVNSGAVERLMNSAYQQGMAEGEFQRVRKDGSRFMASVVVTRRNDPSGRPVGYLVMSSDISERKQAEEKLRYASLYGRSLIEASLDPLVTISADGKITDVNQATEVVTGRSRDQLIGTDFSDYFVEPERARAGYRTVFKEGVVRDYPLEIRHMDGHTTPVLYNASVYRDEVGKVAGVFAAARDITERKRAEEALRLNARYTRSLIEASLDPLVTISAEGKITDVNEATEQVTGVARERLIGSDFADYFTEPDKARQGYRKVLAQGFVRDYPLAIRHTSGRVIDVLYNASVYRDEKGTVLGVFAAARDVTERKKLENGLAQSVAYTRSLIEASLDPLVTISAEGKITDVNEATIKITGVSRDGLIGTDFSNYFTEPEKAREGYRKAFGLGFVTDYPLTIRHVTGQLTQVLYNASVYKDVEGRVLGVFAAARDVTAQKQASQYARSLIEASLDPLVTISAEGKITDVNEATEQVTGVTRDRLIGSDFADYFTEPEKARQGYRKVLTEGFVRDYPLALRHASGKVTEVIYNASMFKNQEGRVQGVFAAARDITERKELERKVQERTVRLEKVLQEAREAINVLSGSASEILSVISNLASGATEAATAVSETTTTVEEVRQTAQLSNQKARDIAGGGKNAAKVLQAGQKNVEAALAEMTRIRDQMGSIAETIVTLSEQSQAIGEITGTVSELAERSNLLAVNAAIEAAKAGEQGKGFAVVAQEIKSLAEQSKQATTQVRGLLAEIQKAIGNAVMATEQSGKVVESGVAQSRQAGESIRVAVEATVEVARASDQIVATSQQQLTGVDQVAIAMENINRASTQNAQSTKQVESVAQNLHELSQTLRTLVERYQG